MTENGPSPRQNIPPNPEKKIGNYFLGKTIGQGTFGKVKLATHSLTGQRVAIKILQKQRIVDVADVERVSRQIHILKLIRHPNIIQLYQIIQTTKHLFLVMQYVQKGQLFNYIVEKNRISEVQACKYFKQIISGVAYLHRLTIVHRDLKPENLLIDWNNNIRIVDFGLSNTYKKGDVLKTACGSPCYAAPQMIANKTYNGLDVDIWSCGVILFAMVCGYLPFQDSNTSALYKKILSGTYTLPEYISDEFKDLLQNVLCVDAVKRYKVEQILNHKWCSISGPMKVAQGLVVGYHRMPIDGRIMEKMREFQLDVEYSSKCIDANKHNHLTTTYYLLLKKTIKEGGTSPADLSSDSFDYESVQPFKRNQKSKSRPHHQKSQGKILDEGKVRIRPIRSFLQKSPSKNINDLSSADINLASAKKSSDLIRIRKSGSSTQHYSTYLKMNRPDQLCIQIRKNINPNLSTDTKRKTQYSINMRSQHRQSGHHHHSTCNQSQMTQDNTVLLKQNDNSSTKMKPPKRKLNQRRNYILADHAKSTEKQTQMRPSNGYYFKSRYI